MWAVGVNCCDSGMTNFHCGHYNNPDARFIGEEYNKMFRLAVEQTEANYTFI